MKQRTRNPVLLELTIIVLFFAVSCGVLAQVIGSVSSANRESELLSIGSLVITAAAENARATAGELDYDEAGEATYTLLFDSGGRAVDDVDQAALKTELCLAREHLGNGFYYAITVSVLEPDGTPVCSLGTGVYERGEG